MHNLPRRYVVHLLVVLSIALGSCRDRPSPPIGDPAASHAPAATTPATGTAVDTAAPHDSVPTASTPAAAPAAPVTGAPVTGASSTTPAHPAAPATASTAPAPTTPRTAPAAPGWNRAEIVEGVRGFVDAIDANNETRFWSSLSRRSTARIDQGKLGPKKNIFAAARESLSDIQNRRITVIGGTRDSVALRIDGLRMIDGARVDDPIIVHLHHDPGAWKVDYPGLLYPDHDLRKGR